MGHKLNILDVVALIEDIPSKHLRKGEVGTIVEHLDSGVYDVEFADNLGRTYAIASLREAQLMLLYTSPAPELVGTYE